MFIGWHVHVCAVAHQWVFCGGQRAFSVSHSSAVHTPWHLEAWSLTESWGTLIRLAWPACPRTLPVCLPSNRLKSVGCSAWLFVWVLGVELRAPCFRGKHFTNWAISPVPGSLCFTSAFSVAEWKFGGIVLIYGMCLTKGQEHIVGTLVANVRL